MNNGSGPRPEVSIVIPVFNETENLQPLFEALQAALARLSGPYEVIFVDDGSTDDSFETLRGINSLDARYKVLRFRRNFGQTAALCAGFDHSDGRVIITLDADMQNDPEDIPKLLEKIDDGYDVVSGWRANRQDALLTRVIPSRIANRLISRLTKVRLHDYGCTLKAYRKEVLDNINLYGEMHRFIPALASWMGTSVAEVRVNHRPRHKGRSKYNLARTPRVLLDLINVKFLLGYVTRPIQIFGKIGLLSIVAGLGFFVAAIVMKLGYGLNFTRNPLILVSVVLTVVGIQFITTGLLGELVVRTYHEVQDKPTYVIGDTVAGSNNGDTGEHSFR